MGIGPAADYHADALTKWPQAEEPSEAAVMLAKGINEPSYFAYLAKKPEASRVFASALTLFTSNPGYSLHYLVDFYQWERFGSGTVVDLGGSVGDAAFAIAAKFPDLNVVVQDLPKTIEAARVKPGVKVRFMIHDFFEEQLVKGADVYMCRWCKSQQIL